jgi:hypothetical protein
MTPRYVGREAAQKANELRFERFYIEREKERERRGDPSPETLGAIEARRQLAETRALEKILDADLQAEPPVTSDVELRVS